MSITLPIITFNDVYRVSQKYVPQPGAPSYQRDKSSSAPDEITVSQFAQTLYDLRDKWDDRPEPSKSGAQGEKEKDGLVLFAGDVFNPSVESSVTRGSHMVPILNALKVDCACVGNHDFDYGFPHLTKLIESTNFPWLLSNIVDTTTGKQPEPLRRFWVTERRGVKIGLIGLVEEDWIKTIPSWPENFEYRSMVDTALELSKELRDPKGGWKCEIVIALTHARVTNDIKTCNELGAVKGKKGVENEHGIDLAIGGHDHIYYIGKGADRWDGFSGEHGAPGTEADQGVRLIKSGTDFRDLTSAILTLSPPTSTTRRRLLTSLTGTHHYILPTSPTSQSLSKLLQTLLSSVSSTLQKPVCFTLTPFDARSELCRTRESSLGNWVADVLMHAYAESLVEGRGQGGEVVAGGGKGKGDWFEKDGGGGSGGEREEKGGADGVFICGGTLRGDSQYGPGKITLGDILEILPFEDPVVCIEIDGKGIWDAMESALSKWPSQEGRFPIIAGMQVEWDHTLPPLQRVKSINLVKPPREGGHDELDDPEEMVDFVEQGDGTRVEVKQRRIVLGDAIERVEGGRMYRIITREYMAQGYDGFDAFKNRKYIIDDENGQIMSSIIRSFLLGSSYIFRHKQFLASHQKHLSNRTSSVIARARLQHTTPTSSPHASPRLSKLSLHSPRDEKIPVRSNSRSISEGGGVGGVGGGDKDGGEWGDTDVKRHVVQHDWAGIRDAMHVAKHEHLSGVDVCGGDEMRKSKSVRTKYAGRQDTLSTIKGDDAKVENAKNVGDVVDQQKQGTKSGGGQGDEGFFVDKSKREELRDELKESESDLAIVCPLVDGRLRDVGGK